MFEFFVLAIAVIALIAARKAMNQAATLKSRLDALEASGWRAAPIPPPLVVHCYAGISRSTASAFVAVCALNPHRDEFAIARQIRAASPIASPNRLIVEIGRAHV